MIKGQTRIGVFLLLYFFSCVSLKAQNIYFNYTDGSSAVYSINDVRKITFDIDLMKLHLNDGTVYTWNVSEIGHYQYDDLILKVDNLLNSANTWGVNVFPNPMNELLNLHFKLPSDDDITIVLYDMQGKILVEKKLGIKVQGECNEAIDVSTFAKQPYTCYIKGKNNTIAKKLIKQ